MSSPPKMSKKRGERLFEAAVRRHFANNIKDAELMVAALVSSAKGGSVLAFNALVDRVDGKPHQSVGMEVEVTSDDTQTASNDELVKALRDRMAGILPKRAVSSVGSGGSDGSGGEKKPH